MKNLLLGLFVLLSLGASAQVEQATLLGQWSDSTLVGSAAFDNTYNEIWGLAVNDREFAIIGSTEGTHFIDVTDPTNPVQVELISGAVTGPSIIHRDFHDDGCFLYVVADEPTNSGAAQLSTLQIIDVSTLPESVKVVYDSSELFFRSHNIFIDEANDLMYAFIANGGNVGFSAMRIYDLSNPVDPQFVAAYNELEGLNISQVHDGYVLDNMAYLNLGPNGFAIVDFTDPLSPDLLGTLDNYPEQGYNHSGWLSQDGQYYYMSDETHGMRMKVVDVSDPTDINVVEFFNAGNPVNTSIPHNQIVACDYLYVSYYYDGLQVYDISNPANPIRIAEFDTSNEPDARSFKGAWGVYPFLPSGNILVADMQEGLFVFEAIDGGACDQRRFMCGQAPVSASSLEVRNDAFNIHPNPAHDFISINTSESIDETLEVTLVDIAGRIVISRALDFVGGNQNFDLPQNISSGVYLLNVKGDDFIFTEKLIIE